MKKVIISLVAAGYILSFGVATAAAVTRMQKSFANWQVNCSDKTNVNQCSLRYALVNKKNKRVVFAWTILPKDKPGGPNKVILRTPMGTSLAEGITILFSGQKPFTRPYKTCLRRVGCISEFDFSDSWAKLLVSFPKFTVSYNSLKGTPIKHEVDLKLFKDAYAFYSSQFNPK